MTKRMICPPSAMEAAQALKMSPAILSGGFLFSTGIVGRNASGDMPKGPEIQFRNVFDRIGGLLDEAGLGFDAIVEMTSYHIGLRAHFDLFNKVRLEYLTAPYPAWTAIEAAGLRRENALVEVRIIAKADPQ